MKNHHIIIYTDGSSRGNPGPGGWGTIVAWGNNVKELGGREKHTTNNRMELAAAIAGLTFVSKLDPVATIDMRVDSRYVINGITKWVLNWKKNGWMNSKKEGVLNRDLWEKLALAVSGVVANGAKISWHYTPGHRGIPGNERADEIATEYADDNHPKLFNGARTKYGVDLDRLLVDSKNVIQKKSPQNKARQKAKAYSYLSLVNGKLMRHTTWNECEQRVKGVKNTKFKKALNVLDEQKIIKEWGM